MTRLVFRDTSLKLIANQLITLKMRGESFRDAIREFKQTTTARRNENVAHQKVS